MNSITFTKATPADIPTLIAIEQSIENTKIYSPMVEASEWEEAMQKGMVYLIHKDGVSVGNVSYEMKSSTHAHISGVVILPEFQRQGIARRAMELLLEELTSVEDIDLVTHPDNTSAISLYTSLGFVEGERIDNYFGDGEPRVVYTRHQAGTLLKESSSEAPSLS